MLGLMEPARWDYDGGVRREAVRDETFTPPRVVRKVGWQHCLRCRKPFFSEDVTRLRLCDDNGVGCRSDETRFA